MTLNIATMIEAVAQAVPDRPAVTCGPTTLTYAELDRRANQLAQHLVEAGIRPGENVGLQMLNGVEYVESLLGCFKARAVPVNINYRYTEHELLHLFTDGDLVAVVAGAEYADRIAPLVDSSPDLRHVVIVDEAAAPQITWSSQVTVVDYEKALAPFDGSTAPRDDLSADDQLIIYTGGTTGLPKGVVWRHEDFHFAALMGGNPYGDPYGSVEEVVAGLENGFPLTYLLCMPLMHGAACYTLFMGLLGGAHLALLRTFDAVEVLRDVERLKVQIIALVGDAQARPIVDAIRTHEGEFDLSSVFVVGSGGAILSASVQADLLALLPDRMIRNSFGASESGADGTVATGADGRMRLQPSPNVRVIDEHLHDVTPGSGELGRLARKGNVPLAYYGDEKKTAETFPVIDGVRWAILGDLAEVEEDGAIVVHGRGSGCINSGGEKIFPEEVEQALKAHPEVMDVLVAGVPDERFGHRVGAVVQLRDGVESFDIEELRTFARATLAGYKVPAKVVLVDEVLRSPSGKADYRWANRTLAD